MTTRILHEHIDNGGDILRLWTVSRRGVLTIETRTVHNTVVSTVDITVVQAIDLLAALADGLKELTR